MRRIPATGFCWVDRRLITDGFAGELPQHELLLYLFLCTVADRDGLSFYGDRRLGEILKLPIARLDHARRGLDKRDLVRYRYPLYQVLELLPQLQGPACDPPRPPTSGSSTPPRAIGEIIARLY